MVLNQLVPLLLSNKEAVAVTQSGIYKLWVAVEGRLKSANDWCVLKYKDILVDFVDVESNANGSFHDKVNLINLLLLNVVVSVLLFESGFKLAEAVNEEFLEVFICLLDLVKQFSLFGVKTDEVIFSFQPEKWDELSVEVLPEEDEVDVLSCVLWKLHQQILVLVNSNISVFVPRVNEVLFKLLLVLKIDHVFSVQAVQAL